MGGGIEREGLIELEFKISNPLPCFRKKLNLNNFIN